jgi:hypothetical protein
MKRLSITLKPEHYEELERLEKALGGVSASNAIAFLLQSQAPRITQVLISASQLNATNLHTLVQKRTEQHQSDARERDFVQERAEQHQTTSDCTKTAPSCTSPSASEAESVLNTLMGM